MMIHERPLLEIGAVIQRRLLCPRAEQADLILLTKGARLRFRCQDPFGEEDNPCLHCSGCGRCMLSEEATGRLVRGFNPR